jgi:hypothetical protein
MYYSCLYYLVLDLDLDLDVNFIARINIFKSVSNPKIDYRL